jgi:hypothetical protein
MHHYNGVASCDFRALCQAKARNPRSVLVVGRTRQLRLDFDALWWTPFWRMFQCLKHADTYVWAHDSFWWHLWL